MASIYIKSKTYTLPKELEKKFNLDEDDLHFLVQNNEFVIKHLKYFSVLHNLDPENESENSPTANDLYWKTAGICDRIIQQYNNTLDPFLQRKIICKGFNKIIQCKDELTRQALAWDLDPDIQNMTEYVPNPVSTQNLIVEVNLLICTYNSSWEILKLFTKNIVEAIID